jgi:hypothetical protein
MQENPQDHWQITNESVQIQALPKHKFMSHLFGHFLIQSVSKKITKDTHTEFYRERKTISVGLP